ncbi:MAG TPA: endolysin [Prochlorococcus sp.]|nr:glycoside hydrolase family 104 protein [Prochlorococcaceae cyanobacterium Fu_MAG_72]|tara:strand:- start:5567 stop:6352 length:786 start_codon:yes stop_codon:yes gene_type:complete
MQGMTTPASTARRFISAVAAGLIPFPIALSAAQATNTQLQSPHLPPLLPPLPVIELSARSQKLSTANEVPSTSLPFIITPERRALLNTIRFAEGTWKNGHDLGYRVMFGGGLMASLERHPNRVIYSSRYASAAAGAYQFMPFTWDMVRRSLGLRGFGPEAQDQGALFLVQRRKAMGLTDTGSMTPLLAAKLAPEWASFPTLNGRSYYGQPVKRFTQLNGFYKFNLAKLRKIRDQHRQDLTDAADGSAQRTVCKPPTILCSL